MAMKAEQFNVNLEEIVQCQYFHNTYAPNTHTHDNVFRKKQRGDTFARKTDFSHRFLLSSFILRRYLKKDLHYI